MRNRLLRYKNDWINSSHTSNLHVFQVHFVGVKYAYSSRPKQLALQGVDLTIKAGQLVALVGLSGSGK